MSMEDFGESILNLSWMRDHKIKISKFQDLYNLFVTIKKTKPQIHEFKVLQNIFESNE